jgi:hypothetical protein
MTKTEQDLKIAEWLSWGLHNGVIPELLVVAATALRAAQDGKTSAPLDAWYEGLKQDEFEGMNTREVYEKLKQDEADAYIDGLIAHGSIPTGKYEPRDAKSIMLDEWLDSDTREQSIQAAKALHPLLLKKTPRKNNKKR